MPTLPASGFQVARPTINLAGQDNAVLAERLYSLEVVETSSGLYRCEASFYNWGNLEGNLGFPYFDRKLLEFGKVFKVKFATDQVFEGRISALEGVFPAGLPPRITVLVEDRLQALRMTRRTRSFENMTDADVVRKIASDHSLTPDVGVTGASHKVLVQVNQSDLAFLRERARALDAEVWVEGTNLKFKNATARGSSPVELQYADQLREFTVLADLAQQCSSLSVTGWDVSGKREIKSEASANAIQSELQNLDGGSAILDSRLGSRKETLAHGVPLSSDDAKSMAESAYKLMARRFVTGRGISSPDERIKVGAKLELKGLGQIFSGPYRVTEVHHVFDASAGLRTEFLVERPGLARA